MIYGPDGCELFHFSLTFAVDISEVVPSTGSHSGGTLLSIQGSGFGITPEAVSVEVGGIPCRVVKTTSTLIQCITEQPPDDSLVWDAGKAVLAGNFTRIPLFQGNTLTHSFFYRHAANSSMKSISLCANSYLTERVPSSKSVSVHEHAHIRYEENKLGQAGQQSWKC